MAIKNDKYKCSRTIQIMPADGWWAVWAHADGSYSRARLVGFGLIEEWFSYHSGDSEPGEGVPSERVVTPLHWVDGYVDYCEANNLISIVHNDEWDELKGDMERLAREYAERSSARKE